MVRTNDYDFSIKTLLIGDSGVGKSSFMKQFVEERFDDIYKCTIGVDYKTIYLDIFDNTIKFLIWDTAGQERFNSITKIYYRNANVIIFIFDITSRDSFDNIPSWIENSKNIIPDSCAKLLVGNKSDYIHNLSNNQINKRREVSFEEAKKFSKLNGFINYYETSTKTNKNIKECFCDIAIHFINNKEKLNIHLSKTSDSIDKINITEKTTNYNKCFC